MGTKDFALVIGVSRYTRVMPLPPSQDAVGVHQLFTDPLRGAYLLEHATLLLEESATREGILAALDAIAARAEPSSRVLVYFSGHGGSLGSDCYLIPVHGAATDHATLEVTCVSGAELTRRLRAITAEQVTVVLDCCHAAGIAEPRHAATYALADELAAEPLAALASGKGRVVMAAAGRTTLSWIKSGAVHGVFTGHLLEGLRGGAHRAGSVVRVMDLYDYVRERVVADMPVQRPVFKAELEENYALVACPGAVNTPLPPPPDAFRYDAFVSYDPAYQPWVRTVLRPRLEAKGIKLCLDYRDFPFGPKLKAVSTVVEASRYTIALITPGYLARGFQQFENAFARFVAAEEGRSRFIPLLRGVTELPREIRFDVALDITNDDEVDEALERLALALREPLPAPAAA